jgi:cyclophilin family peptidyl-prolyl cis-trans isomerase
VLRFALGIFAIALIACSAPRAHFAVQQEDQKAPADIAFENTSERAETYRWDFGDGNESEDISPQHRYRNSGTYRVTLKATKGNKVDTHSEEIKVDAPGTCLVEIVTDYGTMLVQLYDQTPLHRDNFLKLAEESFYDGLLFHRVIDGFMIQGGDPQSKDAAPGERLGTGGPGYQVDAEFDESLVHLKGALAAARTGDAVNPQRRSSGSQFYIVQGQPVDASMLGMIEARNGIEYSPEQREAYAEIGGTPQLDMQYTVFGRVVEGLDVIDKIADAETNEQDRPNQDIWMKMHVVK